MMASPSGPTSMPGPVLPDHCRAEDRVSAEELAALPVHEEIARSRYTPEAQLDDFDIIARNIETQIRELVEKKIGAEEVAA